MAVVIARKRDGTLHALVLVVGFEGLVHDLTGSFQRGTAYGYCPLGVYIPRRSGEGNEMSNMGGLNAPILCDGPDAVHSVKPCHVDAVAVTVTTRFVHEGMGTLASAPKLHQVNSVLTPCTADVSGPRLWMWPVPNLQLYGARKEPFLGFALESRTLVVRALIPRRRTKVRLKLRSYGTAIKPGGHQRTKGELE